jgi:serine/threonine protein kinase
LHSKSHHPNIIRILGSFQEKQNTVIVLEYAENGNLYHYLRKKKKLEEMEAWKYFNQTLKAIDYLHKIDILHRDVKVYFFLLVP